MKKYQQSTSHKLTDVENAEGSLDGKDTYLDKCIAFAEITNTDRALAMMYLQKYDWDLKVSVDIYFSRQQEKSKALQERMSRKRKADESDVIILSSSSDSLDNSLNEQMSTKDSVEKMAILTVLSWNIQGLEKASLNKRMEAVADTILKEEFHVICLQEVVPACLNLLQSKLEPTYHIFSASDHNSYWDYFVAILIRKHPGIKVDPNTISIQEFPNTIMDRHLFSIDLHLSNFSDQSNSELSLRIFTSHLESCSEYSAERVNQLKLVWDAMSSYVKSDETESDSEVTRACVFCGDLNLRDAEVTMVGGLPEGIVDVWEKCGRLPELRSTWDPMRNPNARSQFRGVPRPHLTFRYDRMYVMGSILKPVDFGFRGIEKIKGSSYLASDHWGILGRFLLSTG
ncbi:unnamed protein product [Trichobilharzia szidati]|nr:unnamed protein product [Trichobilharzia szidati]